MLRQLTRLCVRYAERYIPNPYLYAVVLTFITVAAALIWTPSGLLKVVDSWYDGIWNILAFAMQMALILVTGVTLADAPLVRGLLRRLASLPTRQAGAAITVFLAAAVASWLNWGFGLVVGALVAREIAKRLRDVDFGFLVAAAYMGFMTWASGLSSSIALATAAHGAARADGRRLRVAHHRRQGIPPRHQRLHLHRADARASLPLAPDPLRARVRVRGENRGSDPAAVPALRRHHGHHDRHGSRRDHRGELRGLLHPAHAAVLVVRFLQHHHALRALGRRSLGGAGCVHEPGGGQAGRRR